MLTRTMGDSTVLADIPATVDIAATYLNGKYAVTETALEARFPHAKYGWCRIDVTGANADTADVLDVETGDATPATAGLWVQSFRKLRPGRLPVIYCNRSNMAAVTAACAAGGNHPGSAGYGLWVATLDGTQIGHTAGDGIVACQWKGSAQTGGNWDESAVYDDSIWLPVTTAPAPARATVTQAEAASALATLTAYVAEHA